MKKQSVIKILVIGIILICLVLGYYYYLSNKRSENDSGSVKLTAVQEVLLRNLDNNYPPTPREVVKCFCEIAQCLYGESYTEEEFLELAKQAQKLYDEELIANNTQEQYIGSLKWDIEDFKEQEIVISSYTLASSTDVEHFSQDGYSWAQMRCTFNLRKGTYRQAAEEIFLLRKDENGHWKIYGWELEAGESGQHDGEQ